MSKRTYVNQFPTELFTLDVAIPADWEDTSWGNDICPSWAPKDSGLRVWIDFNDVDAREFGQPERFVITGDGETVETDMLRVTFNDWADVLAYVVGRGVIVESRAQLAKALEEAEETLRKAAELCEALKDSYAESTLRDYAVQCWLMRTGGDEPDTKHYQVRALREGN